MHRELANCFFQLGRLDDARKNIDIAGRLSPDNKFVLDLQVQIALQQSDETAARRVLRTLALVDTSPVVHHRKSTIDYRFGAFDDAYEAAVKAFEDMDRPPVAFYSQLIKCEIATNRMTAAGDRLRDLDARFSSRYHDIRVGLMVKWLTANRDFRAALETWSQLRKKEDAIHKYLRYNAIEGILLQGGLGPRETQQLAAQRNELQMDLESYSHVELDRRVGLDD